jgi:membrane protease subunit HflC
MSKSEGDDDIKIVITKGLQFKIPFIQTVTVYTAKNLTYKSRTEVIKTKDNKNIEIAMYAQYRIVDPLKFLKKITTYENIRAKMDTRVYPVVVNSANSLVFQEFFELKLLADLVDEKRKELNEVLIDEYGFMITDIGINNKSFLQSNIPGIEQKMAMQIEKESEKTKSEGDSDYVKAIAAADRERVQIVSEAKVKAAEIKAEADAAALVIYQEALQKDLEFYKFIQRMDIYKNLTDTTVFLDKDNALISPINGY